MNNAHIRDFAIRGKQDIVLKQLLGSIQRRDETRRYLNTERFFRRYPQYVGNFVLIQNKKHVRGVYNRLLKEWERE
jgi:hypothetical protein